MTSNVIDRLTPGSRVAIIRLRALGDCVLSTPAIHLLKRHRPDLEIAVVSDNALSGIFQGNPDIDAVLRPAVAAIRAFHPHLCINFHGGTRSARLAFLSGAAFRAGYDMLRFQWVYNTHIPTAQRILGEQRPVHTAEHMASAIFYLGVPRTEVPAARLYPASGRAVAAPSVPYVVIHPMASRSDKVWPAKLFIETAQALSARFALEPVFIGGTGEDLSAFEGWRVLTGTPLPELARLMRDAELFIGNDSGPAHLASAVSRPEVVLFGSSSVETWSPWRTAAEVLKANGSVESITVEQVLEAAGKLLARTRYDLHSTQ